MSVINKKPLINTILASLTTEQFATLKSLIDGQGPVPVFYSLLPYSNNLLSASNKGVKRAKLEVSADRAQNVYEGYLLYNDTYCALIAYSGEKNPELSLIVMEQINGVWTYQIGNCGLSILELRSELDDVTEAVEGEVTQADLATKSDATNLENGTGTNAVREKMANATVNFSGRNPNAEALDSSLTATLNTGASGNQSAAFGKDTMALSTAAFTNGNKTVAKGEESHAEGYQCVTLGDGSHAEGAQTVAYGIQSHAEGALTQAIADESHAEGHNTIAGSNVGGNKQGIASHAEGVESKTGSYNPDANQGANQSSGGGGGGGDTPPSPGTFTAGEGSHAEGYNNLVVGFGSHAEGLRNYLTGNYAHAEGVNNTNSGNYSHVEGFNNINSGDLSLIVGTWNNNSGYNAFIAGHHNITSKDNIFVAGRYCTTPTSNALLVIGNGTDDSHKSNIFEALDDGIKIGGTKLTEAQLQTLLSGGSGGGTKLYKHTISDGNTGFNIISTQSTAFTNASSIQNAIGDNKVLLVSATEYMGMTPSSIGCDTGNNVVTLYFSVDTAHPSMIQYALNSLTDTVAEI